MPTPVAMITAVTQSEGAKAPSKSNTNDGPAFEEVVRDLDADTSRDQSVLEPPTHQDNPEEMEADLAATPVIAPSEEEPQPDLPKAVNGPVIPDVPIEGSETTPILSDTKMAKTDDVVKVEDGPAKTNSATPQMASVPERMLALQSNQAEPTRAQTSMIENSKASNLKTELQMADSKPVETKVEADDMIMSAKKPETSGMTAQRASETTLPNASKSPDLVKFDAKPTAQVIEAGKQEQANRVSEAIPAKDQTATGGTQITPVQSMFQKVISTERLAKSLKNQAPAEKYEMTWPTARTQNTNTASNIVQAAMNSNPVSTQAIAAANANIQSDLKFTSARLEKNEVREMAFGSADVFETTSQNLRSVAQVVATRGELPPALARQVADALLRSPDRPIELTLSPAELGRVRLSLKGVENSMMVTVLAERPETLELMRRNIEMLDQAMSDLGYENISFSFEQGGANADGSTNNDNETPDQNDVKALSLNLDALPDGEIPNTPVQSLPTNGGGLDVRL